MTTRITDNQLARQILVQIQNNKRRVAELSNDASSGIKVNEPGDSTQSGTIVHYHSVKKKVDGYTDRAGAAKGYLGFQSDTLEQVNALLITAKEKATQGANETLDASIRSGLGTDIFELRNQLVAIANSTYQGRYVWAGAMDGSAPYSAATYTNPSTGNASERYVYGGDTNTRTAQITDDVTVRLNTGGSSIFGSAIEALERLGRSLTGYSTSPSPSGTTDGGGGALDLSTQRDVQTADIRSAIDLLDSARRSQVGPEIASVAARIGRIETVESVLSLTRTTTDQELTRLQSADLAETATALTEADTALKAAYVVNSKVLNQSILDYI